MVPVSLYDEIDIRKIRPDAKDQIDGNRIRIACKHPDMPRAEENIVYLAAQMILQKTRSAQPISIHIKKSIPVGAGLGGGSSDAAATLVLLNRLFNLGLTIGALKKLAVPLGADVPFFIQPRPARARGIGERLTPLPGLPPFWSVIVYPGFPVSTAWVYGNLAQKLTKPIVNTSITPSPRSLDQLARLLQNDLEGVTLGRYPKIGELKRKLLHEGALGVLMSGSGSAVFGIFVSKQAAAKAFRRLRQEEGAQAFLVHALN